MNDNPLKPQIIASPINPTGEQPTNDIELGKRRVALAEQAEWLGRLLENSDFQRYVKTIKLESDLSRRKIDRIEELTAEQSGRYAQKFIAQLDMAEWAERQLEYCRESVKAIDEKRAVQS